MALLFMDSFDHYATADLLEKWGSSGVGGTGSVQSIDATGGRRSSGSLRWVTGTATAPHSYVGAPAGGGDGTAVVGVAFRTTGAPGANGVQILGLYGTTATQVSLRLNAALTLSVLRGSTSGTVLGTTSVALTANTYTYLELKVLVANSGGTVDLRVNGVSVLSLTGQDTQDTATAGWNSCFLGQLNNAANSNAATRTLDYDDLYLLDGTGSAPLNDFLGDCRVDARYPTAAGATTGWTPLAGTNWEAVDEAAPDDDTTYTSTATVGATDTFVTQDAPVAGATIYGLQHCLSMKKGDSGPCTIAPVIRPASTDYPGAALSPTTAYAYGRQIAQTNPATGAAWTEAAFNAAEFGYTRVS